MKLSTYAWLAGACLLLLGGAELVGVLSFFEPPEVVVVILAATGALFSWVGGSQWDHCKRVVGAIGALYLLVGMLACALALLSDASIRSYAGIGGEALFAVIFGLLSLFAAAVLPEPTKPSDGKAEEPMRVRL